MSAEHSGPILKRTEYSWRQKWQKSHNIYKYPQYFAEWPGGERTLRALRRTVRACAAFAVCGDPRSPRPGVRSPSPTSTRTRRSTTASPRSPERRLAGGHPSSGADISSWYCSVRSCSSIGRVRLQVSFNTPEPLPSHPSRGPQRFFSRVSVGTQ